MTIADAIAELQSYPDHNKEIIIAWWDDEGFSDEQYQSVIDNEDSIDWSSVQDQVCEHSSI